jgi:hypothetical protein
MILLNDTCKEEIKQNLQTKIYRKSRKNSANTAQQYENSSTKPAKKSTQQKQHTNHLIATKNSKNISK